MADHGGEVFEYSDERFKSPRDAMRYWRASLDAAKQEEEKWTRQAGKAADIYSAKNRGKQAFNILHSNAQVILSASYSSTPLPDVRTKFLDPDPIADQIGELMERGISHQMDIGDFDATMEQVVLQAYVSGRGVARVRYEPIMHQDSDLGEVIAFEECPTEIVHWRDFRRGPGETWKDVSWVAFRQRMTRDDVMGLLAPEEGTKGKDEAKAIIDQISFDLKPENSDRDSEQTDVLGRAEVWEVWDKEARLVWFVCMSYDKGPLDVQEDPFEFVQFFPCPKPIIYTPGLDTLVPICPYTLYETQADELEQTSQRIKKLTKCLKYRGIRASEIDDLEGLNNLDDGEFLPSSGAMALLMQGKGLDDAIWTVPIDVLIQVIRELVQIREQQKQVIYEITGIADIMRGQTDPNETLGAQERKLQWGSLRIQKFQREIQRFVRDLFRLKAHIVGNIFNEQTLGILNGKPVPPEVLEAIKNDALRRMRIDVETDSTVRGDLGRIQTEQTNFLNATGQFIAAIGPVIQSEANPAGFLPAQVAIEIFQAFARSFRLGRQVEDVLSQLSQASKQTEEAGQDPQEDADRQSESRRLAAEAEKTEAEAEKTRAETAEIHAGKIATRKQDLDEAKHVDDVAMRNADRKADLDKEYLTAGIPPGYRHDDEQSAITEALKGMGDEMDEKLTAVLEVIAAQGAQNVQALEMLAAAMTAPKRLVRDQSGRAVGVETVTG